MPDEPEHRLEKSLRAWAAQCKKDASAEDAAPPDFALHPVNRRHLHEEVRQQYGQAKPETPATSGFSKLILWWPRWGVSLGIFAVLGLVVWQMNWPRSAPMEFARSTGEARDPESPPSRAPAPSSAPKDASSGEISAEPQAPDVMEAAPVLRQRRSYRSAPDQTGNLDASAPTPPPAPVQSQALAKAEPGLELKRDPADPTVGETLALERTENDDTNLRLPRDGIATSSAPSEVLSQFEIQRDAQAVRIVDHDGSVYIGNVAVSNAWPVAGQFADGTAPAPAPEPIHEPAATSVRKQEAPPDPAPLAPGADSMRFSVTGTNRTTGQRIEFTGQLRTNQAVVSFGRTSSAAAEELSKGENAGAAEIPAFTLEGMLRIGTGEPTPVRAYTRTIP